jgi:hypothetical protein
MAGIVQDNLMFPILELIKDELRKYSQTTTAVASGGDPFGGTPEVTLYRTHPLDFDKVTGANMQYDTGYSQEIYLSFGIEDYTELPVEFDPEDNNWEYVTQWLLRRVIAVSVSPTGETIASVQIRLNYDSKWRLTGTSVSKLT